MMYRFRIVEHRGWTGPWREATEYVEKTFRIQPQVAYMSGWVGPYIAKYGVRTAQKRALIIRMLKRYHKNVVVDKL